MQANLLGLVSFSCASQLIRQQSGSLAPTLYTYDNLGNQVKSTVLLDTSHPESVTSNRVNESESHYAQETDGIYSITTSTRYTVSLMERLVSITVPTSDLAIFLGSTLKNKSRSIRVVSKFDP